MDKIEFTKEEILDAVAARIQAKKEGGGGDGADDHAIVTDLYTASLKYSRDNKIDIFSAMERVVREDLTLGQRFLAYVFDDADGK